MRIAITAVAAVWVLATFASAARAAKDADAKAASDVKQDEKAAEWVGSLKLGDAEKEVRLQKVVATHLKAVRDWHNEHPYTTVPAGINPRTGEPLTELDRQVIANSAIPKSVHESLMSGLRQDLDESQVAAILDKYTVGKVDFTMRGYYAIVPDLTDDEAEALRAYLEEARERAVDFKNMDQISAIFEIYKTKCEQHLNANGRNWKQLFKDFVAARQKEKATQQQAN